jgi:polysaccharide biosynthesis transport protein
MTARDVFSDRPTTVSQYVAILRRRKWIIISLPLLTAIVAYLVSTTQSSVYKATAEVSFNRVATTTVDLSNVDPTQFLETQSKLAESPEVARRVAADAGIPGLTGGAFEGRASASPDPSGGDVLDLSATAPNATQATTLANAYANQFTDFRTQLWQASNDDGLRKLELLIKAAQANGQTGSQAYDNLLQQKFQLQYDNSVISSITQVLQPAVAAAKIQPRPRRDAVIGALVGLLLGIGLAFLAEALDTRVRDENEIDESLALPLLGRIPSPPKKLQRSNTLVMAVEPTGVHAEVFRKLRTSFEFVNERSARTVLVTSAGPREGKSTTVANLALALARAGRNVALVDLDLRRPILHTFFAMRNEPGATDAVVGRIDLEDAVRGVALPSADDGFATGGLAPGSLDVLDENGAAPASKRTATNGHAGTDGVLHFLPSGTIPPAADEFLERQGVDRMIAELAKRFDFVLIDAPPLLAVGDSQTLSAKIDAMLIVTHTGIHRRQLQELARQLQNCSAPALGYVLTGVSHSDSYSYGYGYDPHVYDTRSKSGGQRERV